MGDYVTWGHHEILSYEINIDCRYLQMSNEALLDIYLL